MQQKFTVNAALAAILLPLPLTAFSQQTDVLDAEDSNATATATAATVARDESSVSFEVGAGLEYDSNVALLDLDTSTNAGDTIASLALGVAYDMPNQGRFDFRTGYNFSETAHEDFSAFDLRLHRGSGTLSWDFGRVDAGAILQYARAELDGNDFLTLTQIAPYVTKLAGEKLFLRFAYTDSDKDYASNPQRAATATAWSSEIYVFLNGLKTYLLFGLRRDDEDAIDPQFDYFGDKLRVQLTHRFALSERELTFRAGLRSETRDYTSVTPSIGMLRRDDRVQFEASAELPVGERVTATIDYKRADNQSNLAAVDFNENVMSLAFSASF